MSAATLTILPESIAVDNAATKALELVNNFANNANNVSNPEEMFAELDHARNDVLSAWNSLELAMKQQGGATTTSTGSGAGTTETRNSELTDFRPAFMDMITDAFGDVLDDLRRSSPDGEIDVNVLVDILESGMDLFVATANDENDFSWNRLEEEDDDNDIENYDDDDDDDDDDDELVEESDIGQLASD